MKKCYNLYSFQTFCLTKQVTKVIVIFRKFLENANFSKLIMKQNIIVFPCGFSKKFIVSAILFSHFETDKQEEGRIKRKKNKFKKSKLMANLTQGLAVPKMLGNRLKKVTHSLSYLNLLLLGTPYKLQSLHLFFKKNTFGHN